MIISGQLSLSQKERGRTNYNWFNLINGLSYMCLGETIIILFAMQLQCPDWMVSALGAFFYLGNFAMPCGKFLTSRIGATRSVSLCWVMRNFAAMLVASASLLNLLGGKWLALSILALGAFLFYSCRSAGTVIMQPLVGEITTPENRGKFISSSNRWFYLSCLICLAIIMVILRYYQNVWTLSIIIFIGSAFGFTSAYFLYRIDESEDLRTSAKEPILADMVKTLKDGSRRMQLIANYSVSTICAMTAPICMLALKRGYGISDTDALLFALIQFAGAILVTYIIGFLSEETGPRPIIILSYLSAAVLCCTWIFAPGEFNWRITVWPFLIAGCLTTGTAISLQQYFLITIPNKERVASSLTIYVASGVLAGLTAMFLGGALLDLLASRNLVTFYNWLSSTSFGHTLLSLTSGPLDPSLPVRPYQAYYIVVVPLILLGLIPILKLRAHSNWKISDVLGLAFAPKDILALYNLYSFNPVAGAAEELENINKFQEIHSELSEKAFLAALDSPKLSFRGKALFGLSELPLSPEGVKAVLHELEYGEHTTANMAAQICGNKNIREAIPILRNYLFHTSDYYLKSKAMVSLAQMKDTDSYAEIERIFSTTENPRLIMHGASALSEIGTPDCYTRLMRKIIECTMMSDQAVQEVLYSAAEIAGYGEFFYKFMKLYKTDPFAAVQMMTEYCTAHGSGVKTTEMIFDLYYDKIHVSDAVEYLLKQAPPAEPLPEIRSQSVLILTEIQNQDLGPVSPKRLIYCMIPIFCCRADAEKKD